MEKLSYKRLEEITNELIGYVFELKDNECREDLEVFWKDCIGLSDEEMEYFSIDLPQD